MTVMIVVMKMEIGVMGLINSSSLWQSWPLDIQVTQVRGATQVEIGLDNI